MYLFCLNPLLSNRLHFWPPQLFQLCGQYVSQNYEVNLTSFFFSSPTPLKLVPIPARCPIFSECHRHSSSYSIVNLEVFLNPSSPSDPISDKFCIFCLLNISKSSLLSPMFTTIVLVQFFFFWCGFLFSITCITAIERKLKLCQLIHLYIKYSLSTHAVSDSEQSLRMK